MLNYMYVNSVINPTDFNETYSYISLNRTAKTAHWPVRKNLWIQLSFIFLKNKSHVIWHKPISKYWYTIHVVINTTYFMDNRELNSFCREYCLAASEHVWESVQGPGYSIVRHSHSASIPTALHFLRRHSWHFLLIYISISQWPPFLHL